LGEGRGGGRGGRTHAQKKMRKITPPTLLASPREREKGGRTSLLRRGSDLFPSCLKRKKWKEEKEMIEDNWKCTSSSLLSL